MSPTVQRVIGALVLLVAGLLSLPLAATFLDDPGNENWIVPALLLLMAAVGAGVAVALPALARAGAPTWRRALTGVWWGLRRGGHGSAGLLAAAQRLPGRLTLAPARSAQPAARGAYMMTATPTRQMRAPVMS